MTSVVAAHHACNLCETREVSVIGRRGRSGKPLRTVACLACGLVWSDPRPEGVRKYYERDYRLAYKHTFEPKPKHVLRAGRVALQRFDIVRPLLRGSARVLDVGSGGGEFAYLLSRLGHRVQGVEPNMGYARYAATQYDLDITVGMIADAALGAGDFDLITIWHVLEHTEDPGAVLLQLSRALSADGRLVVEVPNVEASCQAPHNTFHEAHLYSFNQATLEALAAKSGLAVVSSTLSPDGGNITIVLRKLPTPVAANLALRVLHGNHRRVSEAVHKHTPLRYWTSWRPYSRAARRFGRLTSEFAQRHTLCGGRALLDSLYGEALESRAEKPKNSHTQRPGAWRWLTMAYVGAVLLEGLLLDRVLSLHTLSDDQALGFYLMVQSGVALLLTRVLRRGDGWRAALRVALPLGPLFLVPVYC